MLLFLGKTSDEKAHKPEETRPALVLKFLVHKVSPPDLETNVGPASSKVMK